MEGAAVVVPIVVPDVEVSYTKSSFTEFPADKAVIFTGRYHNGICFKNGCFAYVEDEFNDSLGTLPVTVSPLVRFRSPRNIEVGHKNCRMFFSNFGFLVRVDYNDRNPPCSVPSIFRNLIDNMIWKHGAPPLHLRLT